MKLIAYYVRLYNLLTESDAQFKEFVIYAVSRQHARNTADNLCGVVMHGCWEIGDIFDIEGEVSGDE